MRRPAQADGRDARAGSRARLLAGGVGRGPASPPHRSRRCASPPGHRGPHAGVRRGVRHARREPSLARADANVRRGGPPAGPLPPRCLRSGGTSGSRVPRVAGHRPGACVGRLHGGVRRRVHRPCARAEPARAVHQRARSCCRRAASADSDGQRRSIAELAARRRRRHARRRGHRAGDRVHGRASQSRRARGARRCGRGGPVDRATPRLADRAQPAERDRVRRIPHGRRGCGDRSRCARARRAVGSP